MKKISLITGIVLLLSACSSNEPTIIDEKEALEVQTPNQNPEDSTTSSDPNMQLARISMSEDERGVMESINEFSYDLICSYAKESNPTGNFSISPVSVSIFFSMLANATDGVAQQEIFNLLKTDDLAAINSLSRKLMEYLPSESLGTSLNISNRFWVADRYVVPESFSTIVKDFYNADVVSVDFSKPTTVPSINQWVSQNTNGLINALLYENWETYLNSNSIAANTVYFKGDWKSKFDKDLTKKEWFSTPAGKISTNMMHKKIETNYASNEDFQLVTLPYKSGHSVLELYLPNEEKTPYEMATILTPDMQNSLLSKSRIGSYEVILTLPKFESRSGQKYLNPVLKNLGAEELFRAVYRPMGITDHSDHWFTHETVIKVDEEGTELAAVTGDIIVTSNGESNHNSQPKTVTVTFDRPFMFIVRNFLTDAILMAGVITNP